MKILAYNKKAFHDYTIEDTLEAGIILTGDEVKSARTGRASLAGAFATIHRGELYLTNCSISIYAQAYTKKADETRQRKLLVHRRELNRLVGDISRKGLTLIPLKMYLNADNRIKLEIGVAKHKKAHERKEEIRERDIQRQTRRELRGKYDY